VVGPPHSSAGGGGAAGAAGEAAVVAVTLGKGRSLVQPASMIASAITAASMHRRVAEVLTVATPTSHRRTM
jgi:hypothetical protein